MPASSFAAVMIAGLGALFWPTRAAAEPPPSPPSAGFPLDEPAPSNSPATRAPKPAPEAPPGDEPKPAHQTPEPGRDTSQRASAEAAGSKKPEPRAPIAAAPQQLFGEKGQLVFKNDFELSLGHTTGEPTTFGVVIRPSLDYFVMAGFSLGLALNFSHEQQAEDIAGLSSTDKLETKTDSYGIGLDAGGNVRLSELFSIWFQGFLGVYREHVRFPQGPSPDDPIVEYARKNETGVDIGAYAPLLIHPVAHFFFGIGPLLRYDHLLSQDSTIPRVPNSITVAARSTLGGWF